MEIKLLSGYVKMIEIPTAEDLTQMWTKLQEVMERTKRHTIQIKELQKEQKKNDNPRTKKD